ncbi:hypothetical protein Tco_0895212 [Tanacetum coccineum]|uniref:Uncharacterized protein n=1 Tax=Tanacetum coccineum TaxID=301880 RepID=A0ABQ5CE06_9ASTR
MSRANPQAAIVSEEQLVPRANRLTIKKNNQRVALDSDITDTLLRLIVGILRHHKLYKPVSLTATVPVIYLQHSQHDTSTTSTRGIKVSKLNLLRNQKSNMCLQSEVEEEKVICVQLTIVEEPVAVELANSISIEEQRHQQRPTIEASAVQSLLDLRKGSKSEDISATDNDATQDSSCSDTDEEKEDETDASDDSDMDLSADEPQGDDEVVGYGKLEALTSINVSKVIEKAVQAKVLTEIKKLLPTHVSKAVANQISLFTKPSTNTDDLSEMELKLKLLSKMQLNKSYETLDTHLQLYNNLYESVSIDQEALDTQDAEPSFHKRTHDEQDPHNDRWLTKKSRAANATNRRTTWFDLLLKSDIDKNEDHILGPSTVAIAKKLKELI